MSKQPKNDGRHQCLPQKLTVEELAKWITENAHETRNHEEHLPLTEEQALEYKEKIALTTAKLYDLAELKKEFERVLKDGTPFEEDEYKPVDFTIPPTKGTKSLEENRKYADSVLKQGHETVITPIYGIAWIEGKRSVFVDIEGKVYFDEPMSEAKSVELNAEAQLFPEEDSPLEA